MLNLFQHLIMSKIGFVYIMGNKGLTLYIGVTSNLIGRADLHKSNLIEGFTSKYKLHKLLYYEVFEDIVLAIKREKQLKNWHREWKLGLIRSVNPYFRDLYEEILKQVQDD